MSRSDAPRFPEIQAPDAEQLRVANEIIAGPRGQVGGAFTVLLHSAPLASHLQKLGAYLRYESPVPHELRALATLVTAAHWRCGFEWDAHTRLVRDAAELAEPVIAAVARGEVAPDESEAQAAVHRYCLALLRQGAAGDAEFAAVERHVGRAGALDLAAVCGYYSMLAMVLNLAMPAMQRDVSA